MTINELIRSYPTIKIEDGYQNATKEEKESLKKELEVYVHVL